MFRLTKIEGGRIIVFEPEFIEASAIDITDGVLAFAFELNNSSKSKISITAPHYYLEFSTLFTNAIEFIAKV